MPEVLNLGDENRGALKWGLKVNGNVDLKGKMLLLVWLRTAKDIRVQYRGVYSGQ
jgi:hypothetical protein